MSRFKQLFSGTSKNGHIDDVLNSVPQHAFDEFLRHVKKEGLWCSDGSMWWCGCGLHISRREPNQSSCEECGYTVEEPGSTPVHDVVADVRRQIFAVVSNFSEMGDGLRSAFDKYTEVRSHSRKRGVYVFMDVEKIKENVHEAVRDRVPVIASIIHRCRSFVTSCATTFHEVGHAPFMAGACGGRISCDKPHFEVKPSSEADSRDGNLQRFIELNSSLVAEMTGATTEEVVEFARANPHLIRHTCAMCSEGIDQLRKQAASRGAAAAVSLRVSPEKSEEFEHVLGTWSLLESNSYDDVEYVPGEPRFICTGVDEYSMTFDKSFVKGVSVEELVRWMREESGRLGDEVTDEEEAEFLRGVEVSLGTGLLEIYPVNSTTIVVKNKRGIVVQFQYEKEVDLVDMLGRLGSRDATRAAASSGPVQCARPLCAGVVEDPVNSTLCAKCKRTI